MHKERENMAGYIFTHWTKHFLYFMPMFVSFKIVCYFCSTSCRSTLLMLSTRSPPALPCSTVSGCMGETTWALQCVFDQKEDRVDCARVDLIIDLKWGKCIIYLQIGFSAKLFWLVSQARLRLWDSGAHTLRLLVVFHWKVLTEYKKRRICSNPTSFRSSAHHKITFSSLLLLLLQSFFVRFLCGTYCVFATFSFPLSFPLFHLPPFHSFLFWILEWNGQK